MSSFIQLSIPKPCHENWHNMTPEAKGRFCSYCHKTVIDFTTMTDSQVLAHFKNHKGSTCGSMYTNQLQTPMPLPVKRIPWHTYFFRITIPAFLFAAKAQAQDTIKPAVSVEGSKLLKGRIGCNIKPTPTTREIRGRITDTRGLPIPFASILIKGTNSGVQADVDGKFDLTLAMHQRLLEVSSMSFEPKTVRIKDNSVDEIIELTLNQRVMGEVVVTCHFGPRKLSKKKAKTDKMVNINEMIMFPNPVPASSALTIQWNFKLLNDQEVEIYSISGALIQRETITAGLSKASIQLKTSAPGNYVVKVVDVKTRKVESRQVIVE